MNLVPNPTVTVTVHLTANDSIGNAYVGSTVTLQCQIIIHYTVRIELVVTHLAWYKGEASLNYVHSNLTFQHVREIDSGLYTCIAAVRPMDWRLSTYILNGNQSSTVMLHVKS